jgi:hypothetical protein
MKVKTWNQMQRRWKFGLVFGLLSVLQFPAHAFCGFYVGKADASLFNEASQVIMAREGNRTVLSMLNDYKGELTEFALVVPVPTVLQRDQINVGDRRIFDRLDSYSSPRLAEYHDPDPCAARYKADMAMPAPASAPRMLSESVAAKRALGVVVEASYTVGEYDIVMLSATQSDGLETWLTQNGYRIPAGASRALGPYIKQGMKFFVAKVNLKEQAKTGSQMLRPLQFAFESEKFMLPLRLGMINANGPQDLIVYMLSRTGRVESTNYRTVKLPANMDLPVFVRSDFKSFYKSMFDQQAEREAHKVVFTEYFWDMGWCDPCAADPLSTQELRQAGAFWVNAGGENTAPNSRRGNLMNGGAQPAMLTRLHVRYTRETFPEDLMFQETKDRQNFQTRYVLRHPFKGPVATCDAAKVYYQEVARRQEHEAQQLASLTGWSIASIREKLPPRVALEGGGRDWWRDLWSK